MRAKEFLSESKKLNETALTKSDFGAQERKQDRIAAFTKLFSTPNPEDPSTVGPFMLTNGQSIFLKKDPAILRLLKSLTTYDYKNFPTNFTAADGRPVSLGQLEKTKQFGGDSKHDNPLGKQALQLKPSDLSISAHAPANPKEKFNVDSPDVLKQAMATGAFPAGELATKIQTDPVLQSDPVGLKVIEMSKQISAHIVPDMPSRKELPNTALAAIRDYGGEYLGVQQLIDNTANFPHAEAFYKFMDTGPEEMSNLMLYFPKSTNTPLADSLALKNTGTGHVIKLSSKGGKEGAPPSLDNLKIPEEYRKKRNKDIANVVKFIDAAQQSQAKNQPFRLAELLTIIAPESIPKEVREIFPVSQQEFDRLYATKKDPRLPCPQKFKKLANIKGLKGATLSGTHYGRVHYQLNKVVLDAINRKNALPAFRKTALELLGYNFVQIYSRVRQDKLFADVLWPGKVNGIVEIYSKSSSADPDHQKISFSVKDQ